MRIPHGWLRETLFRGNDKGAGWNDGETILSHPAGDSSLQKEPKFHAGDDSFKRSLNPVRCEWDKIILLKYNNTTQKYV